MPFIPVAIDSVAIDATFTATISTEANSGWTCVVMPDSGTFIGTREAVKVSGLIDGHAFHATLRHLASESEQVPPLDVDGRWRVRTVDRKLHPSRTRRAGEMHSCKSNFNSTTAERGVSMPVCRVRLRSRLADTPVSQPVR